MFRFEMVRAVLVMAAIAVFGSTPTYADGDPMAAAYANSMRVTDTTGAFVDWWFDADGLFSTSDGQSGAWSVDAGDLCLVIGQDTSCSQLWSETMQVGDTWSFSAVDGGMITVELRTGR